MDTEKSGEVLDASEPLQPEETVMEKEAVSKLETPEEESTEPEKPPSAEEETVQLAVNGHDTEVTNLKETEELIVTLTNEMTEMKVDDGLPNMEESKADMAPPEPVESSEMISDPVAALDTEPENTEQKPAPENKPEPLAESVPEPEPEKLAESVPEAELKEQTSPEPVMIQQSVDIQPPKQEENVSEQVETAMDTESKVFKPKEEEKSKTTESVLVAGISSEPAEAVMSKEESSAESGNMKPAEEEVKPDKSVDPSKGAEAAAEGEGIRAEQNDAEKEEDPVPASGSLSFALLEQDQTKDALRNSRTLVVLRGLPGSGKSFLARSIADAYKDHCSCTIVSADDHDVKPENTESSADGYKALDEAVVARCSDGTTSSVLVVVDDTNHTQDRLACLGEIATQHRLVVVFLEPQTEWSRDPAQLAKKTRRGLEEAQLEAMKGLLEQMTLPLYFGWFLLSSIQDKIECTAMDFLKTLDTLEAFKKHSSDFTGKPEKEVDLEQYFEAKGVLHCTTKFCDYGNAEGAKDYAQKTAVKEFYGSVFELSLSALFVTPRTVGARVSLTEEQLVLWPADAESVVPAAASLPLGSRAHVTLGCANGVEPVQTGLDLLEILLLQQEGQQGELVEEMELGSLTYYGEGRWLLNLREPICVPACFSSFFGCKEQEPTKKEPEKKKKPKCTIL
ncbi:2',3'-cyclic-nucleotide 3'-phosphodiesterase isoform X2 [Parambassis ranga]|uniref:2',3'-cyclic-nucleotide 3'-phosphodiesterase n=1 Tax=Parambassis ranga TaxID=210632 RepID=A0A6P7ISG0_9TELE|nr:2',3'-cyclic-nucleotide 3'-phosphodiesterase isoform X2 [Parambassis ranga]